MGSPHRALAGELSRRILLVEDEPTMARDLKRKLVQLGCDIIATTPSGEHAIVLAETQRPDLVLMDIQLEGEMDGIAAAEQIRARVDIPVVFLTGHAGDRILRAACATEPAGYIVKPCAERELGVVIELALYRRAVELERRQLEQQTQRADKMQAIGQLAGGIAHDFNNVLMVILASCAAIDGLPAGRWPHAQVALIRAAAERAARMTQQLLAFGRADRQPAGAVDLGLLISTMTGMLGRLIGDDIAVDTTIEPGLRAVRAPASELEQVILNLVINARDAMPGGGAIAISASNDGGDVVLAVADAGHGMDEATQRRAFEPFFTTKQVGAGAGLGLATVYAIVARAGGRIDVASTPGRGTTFTIRLPATDQPLGRPEPAAADAGPLAGTIVVVEDDEQVRAVIGDILRDAGLDVIEARDGVEALAACRRYAGHVDIVLSDVVMPRMTGHELSRALAVDQPEIALIYMSGYPDRSVPGSRLDELGPVLVKPFSAAQLLERVRSALRPAR